MSDKYAALRAAEPYELRFSRLWERYDEACHGNAEHMRDILELALDALETAERRIAKSDRYFLELLAERDADKRNIEKLRLALRRYSMSAGQADQRKSESIAVRMALGFDADAEDVAPVDLCECIQALKNRVAELEARTLTVKLPQRASAEKYVDEAFSNNDLAAIYNACRLECEVKIKDACAAAGISLKIEGE